MPDRTPKSPLTGIVLFVTDLDRSAAFYHDLLGLDVALTDSEALMMQGPAGFHLYLRSRGGSAANPVHLGIQYGIWALDSAEELTRAEAQLTEQGAFVSHQVFEGIDVIEGFDPDRIPIILHYPSFEGSQPTELFRRIYAY